MSTPVVTPYPNTEFEKKLHRFQRQRDLRMRGYERHRMSPQLAEALRTEIRQALDADGKPFDVTVAQRVYDLAIAAKDMCVAATVNVAEAIKTIANVGGPIESLGPLEPDAPAVQAQASETFGARIMRELMAAIRPKQDASDDPKALVHALAEARRSGMTDVAEALEVKLFGAVLTGPKAIAPVIDPYEQGYFDGKRGVPPVGEQDEEYRTGYMQGTEMRFLEAAKAGEKPEPEPEVTTPHAFEARTTERWKGPPAETCEHCGTDPRNLIHDWQAGPQHPRPPSGAENAFAPEPPVEIVVGATPIDDEKKSVWPKGVSLDEAERLYKENLLEQP